ncbi:T9SS type B sorting domain-containing protein [Flavobacterium enshiense]|uniref:T9SS type B sorting domain-containing protein n=1 Tax=Flavobacterium enshiense TaxID=1341165 RepID=UPI00345D6785
MRLLTLFLILIAHSVSAQLSSKHWIPPLHSRDATQIEDYYLYLSTPETTPIRVTITYGDGTLVTGSPFTISQSSPQVIFIGQGQPTKMFVDESGLNTVESDKGLILSSSRDFYASFRLRAQSHSETLISKGIPGIGTAFRIGHMINEPNDQRKNFITSFMATQDNTQVTVSEYDTTVIFESSLGPITDDTQTFVLNAGESVVLTGHSSNPGNITGFIGALISATKPIAVNAGNSLGGIENLRADFCLDQIVSTSQIGSEYIFIQGNGLPEMEKPLIIAHENNTEIFINGSSTAAVRLNAGDYYLIPNSFYQGTNNKNIFVRATKPVFAYQLIGGGSDTATSGLNFIPPLSCFFQNSVTVPAVNEIGNTQYSTDLMVLTYASATLTLNGSPISTDLAQAVQGNTEWVTYRIPNASGNVTLVSTGPLALGVFGYLGNASGYAGYYSGFGSTPQDTDVVVCTNQTKDIFEAIIGNPEPGGVWTVPAGGAPIVNNIFDPAVHSPGQYTYSFSKNCSSSVANFSVRVNVSVQNGQNPGTDTQKTVCKNDPTFDLFALLGPNAETGGYWTPTLASGTNIFDPNTDITGTYIYTLPANNVCEEVSAEIIVTVNPLPTVATVSDYSKCDDNLDGNDSNGSVTFNLSFKNTEVLQGQTGITVTYHTNSNDALNGNNAITSITSGNRIIYARLRNTATGCFNTTSFNLVVVPKPTVSSPVTLKQCDVDQDAFTNFNLHEADEIINNGSNLTFSYFTSLNNAENNLSPITNDTNFPSGNRRIWARVDDNNTGCYRTAELNLVVSATQIPASFNPVLLNECDELVNNASQNDAANNGYDFFDLGSTRNTFLALFTNPSNLTVSYYTSLADAEAEINAIDTTVPFRNTIPDYQPIFVRIDSNTNNDCMGLGNYINLQVNPIPNVNLGDDFLLCLNPQTGLGSQIIDATPAISGNYSYLWTPANPDADTSGNESAQYNVTQPGNYSVVVTNTDTNCSNTDSVVVTGSSEPLDVTVVLLTPLFSNGLAEIEATAIGGYGQYEYSVDGIHWQTDGLFTDLQNGSYTVQVRDILGCGPIVHSEEFYTITYQNFFTPNGDGFNDTWKIGNMPLSYNAKLYIFDRYGKLLKQISQDGKGWDGTYNGIQLPATDYWFKVEYIEHNAEKTFTSHFSLKR